MIHHHSVCEALITRDILHSETTVEDSVYQFIGVYYHYGTFKDTQSDSILIIQDVTVVKFPEIRVHLYIHIQ